MVLITWCSVLIRKVVNITFARQTFFDVAWAFLSSYSDVNQAVDTFYVKVYEIFDFAVSLFHGTNISLHILYGILAKLG
ncbi:MAG: hypothetical protein KTM48_01425, partial [Wolbachia endosymbiont of Pissodes strobi]|nr:hypothetical protein [Wolbachia endosymbiont of Pissodes strobi]